MKVPFEDLVAQTSAIRVRTPAASLRAQDQWVAFFASQADEATAEESLPDPQNPASKARFGVFTHQIHHAATGWSGSFADLALRLKAAYAARPFPTPEFQGQLQAVPKLAKHLLAGK